MYPLNIDIIFFKIFNYLDIIEISNLSKVSKNFKSLCYNERLWEMKYYTSDNIQQNFFRRNVINNFLKKSKNICMLCDKHLITDIIITLHACNNLKKCLNCYEKKCICDGITYYHSKCLLLNNNICFKCNFCDCLIKGFFIKILI